MPANVKPIKPWPQERHLDLQSDLQSFFDTLVAEQRVLDVGAGLGRSKERITRNRVTTYEPSPFCRDYVDICQPELPAGPYDVVTAFEVLEHIEDDIGFLRSLDRIATRGIFLTTPNWAVAKCQSDYHYREYTHQEFVDVLRTVWPMTTIALGAYFKNVDGGWCKLLENGWMDHAGLKHLAWIRK